MKIQNYSAIKNSIINYNNKNYNFEKIKNQLWRLENGINNRKSCVVKERKYGK